MGLVEGEDDWNNSQSFKEISLEDEFHQ